MENLPPLPPTPPPQQRTTAAATLALGEDPTERVAIPNTLSTVEAILRQPRRVVYHLRQPGAGRLIGSMVAIALVCSVIYGVVVGSFSMGMQLWAAPLKIAGGLLFAGLICLPSLYIFSCLSGSQARFLEIVGLVCGLLVLMTVLLIGFAPIAWLFSQSTQSQVWMGTLHLLFWGIATLFGLRFLELGFTQTMARSKAGLHVWVMIFILVLLQMTTALRPLVGTAETLLPTEKKFFLSHWGDCLNSASTTQ